MEYITLSPSIDLVRAGGGGDHADAAVFLYYVRYVRAFQEFDNVQLSYPFLYPVPFDGTFVRQYGILEHMLE